MEELSGRRGASEMEFLRPSANERRNFFTVDQAWNSTVHLVNTCRMIHLLTWKQVSPPPCPAWSMYHFHLSIFPGAHSSLNLIFSPGPGRTEEDCYHHLPDPILEARPSSHTRMPCSEPKVVYCPLGFLRNIYVNMLILELRCGSDNWFLKSIQESLYCFWMFCCCKNVKNKEEKGEGGATRHGDAHL